MKVRIIIAAIAAALGLAAPAHAAPPDTAPTTTPPLPPPTRSVTATCDGGLTITTAGYPEGAGAFSIGSEPQRPLPLNSTTHVDWPINVEDTHHYTIMFMYGGGQGPDAYLAGSLDCPGSAYTPPPPPEPVIVPVIEPTVAVDEPPAVEPITEEFTATWAHVELAPPW